MYCVFLGKARETVTVPTITKDKLNLISTSSSAGLEVKGDGTTDGTIQLNCSRNSHGIKLASPPHSAGQSYTLTFPQSISADTFLKTDGSGNLSFAAAGGANTPAFSAHAASQTLNDQTSTKLVFGTELYDTDSAYNASTGRFTVPSGKAGKYFFSTKYRIENDAGYIQVEFYKNGSEYIGGASREENGYGSQRYISVATSFSDSLSVGDYIEAYAYMNVGNTNGIVHLTFTGFKLIE